MLNSESGLEALTGDTSDMKKILAARATDPRAKLAFEIYGHAARKQLLGMAASLGGLDTVVFTGGIGEHAAEVRDEITRGLAFVGIGSGEKPGRVAVEIVPTDEEERILHHAEALLGS
jgi:acetate kinase